MKPLPDMDANKAADLLIPSLDHKEPEDKDCRPPEHPIFQMAQSIFGKITAKTKESERSAAE